MYLHWHLLRPKLKESCCLTEQTMKYVKNVIWNSKNCFFDLDLWFHVSLPLENKTHCTREIFMFTLLLFLLFLPANMEGYFCFYLFFRSIWSPFPLFSPQSNTSTLKSHSDVFLSGLSCQVGRGAMDVVKGLLASEGQSASVMNVGSFWIVIRERKKLNTNPSILDEQRCLHYL